jgi:hypothetical protein
MTMLPEAQQLHEIRASEDHVPSPSSAQIRFPASLKASPALAGFAAVIGLFFVFLSRRPLWHTDLWGHLAYGRWIWNTGRLPATEPLMPLSSGVPFVDSAWFSQIVGFATYSYAGVAGLQFLYAASIALCLAILAHRGYRRTGNAWITLGGLALFVWVGWHQMLIIRPQLAGMVCFVGLLSLVATCPAARRRGMLDAVLVFVLFAAWANLHGSFPVGWGLLGCVCLGRAADLVRRTGRLSAVTRDARFRRSCWLTALAVLAVLFNPYGWRLFIEVLTFADNPNLTSLREWDPLTLRMSQGRAAAAAAAALIVLYRLSPRRIQSIEVFLLAGLGAASLWTSRMIVWWAPVAAYYFMLHAGAVWKLYRRRRPQPLQSPRSSLWTAVTAGVIAVCIVCTPLGASWLGGRAPEFRPSVSAQTPVEAVEYLVAHPPVGQVFNTYEWGDYLLWAGPADVQVFAASHAHLVPRDVWVSYLRVIALAGGWDDILDRYAVNTVLVDYRYRRSLIRALKRDDRWQIAYEDRRSIVFVRRELL